MKGPRLALKCAYDPVLKVNLDITAIVNLMSV